MKTPSFLRSAFSLIEMLVVVSIIGIISAFAVPATTRMVRGTDVNRAAQMVADQLSSARQTAISRNKQIEIRFLRFADPEQPGEKVADKASWKIRGIQLMEVTSSGVPVQLGPIQRLPGSMMLNEGRYSSLFDTTSSSSTRPLKLNVPTDIDPPMPRLPADKARAYSYAAFRFLPDGSTTLAVTGKWYVTLHSVADAATLAVASSGDNDPIKKVNYFTVQIDPISGATHSYRPQLGV